MNVIVICIDTLRADYLGCYGNTVVRTPAIDSFARCATRFEAAYCASFPTIPIRTDLFTGLVKWPIHGWKPLGEDELTLPEVLRESGYWTAFVHDTSNMESCGFPRVFDENHWLRPPPDRIIPKEEVEFPVPRENLRQNGGGFVRDWTHMAWYEQEIDWAVARTMLRASRWLEENHRRDKFFLWVDTFEPHELWHAPAHYVELYSRDYEGLDYLYPNYGYTDIYTLAELERMRAHYAAEVTLTDRWVGHLLRTIEDMRLLDSTLVVLMSDHGMYLGEHGRTGKHTVDPNDPWPILDEVGRLAFVVSVPGRRGPRHVGELVQPADLMPTVLDYCGLTCPPVYGRSWRRLIDDPHAVDEHWDCVFTSCHSGEGEGRIAYLPSDITVTAPGWTYVTGPGPEPPRLYDRAADPGQATNVLDRHREAAAPLHRRLVGFMREVGASDEYVEAYARFD